MFQSAAIALRLIGGSMPFAQTAPVIDPTITPRPEDAALVFSGPQIFAALISGLVLAFAFQLLLTNLGVGAALSLAGGDPDKRSSDRDRDSNKSDADLDDTLGKVGFWLGLGTLVSVSIALFVACYLAVKLSLIASPAIGAIIGLVIWGAYFSLLVWVSSTTVGSFIGSVINTATSGVQALLGTATAAIGAKTASNQVVATAEAAAAAVRRELTGAIDPEGLREQVEDYIQAIRPPELDLRQIRSEFDKILGDVDLKDIAQGEALQKIDRQAFVDLVSARTDLSKRDIDRVVDQLEDAWNQTVKQAPKRDAMAELVDYLKSAAPGQIVSDQVSSKLDELIAELRSNGSGEGSKDSEEMGMMAQAQQMGLNALMGLVLGRTDFSDLDVAKIVEQIKQARDRVTDQADRVAVEVSGQHIVSYNTIRTDIENYLLNAYPWQLKPAILEQEFREVLYDPQADPSAIRSELEPIRRQEFVDLLTQKGLFTQAQIQAIASQLETIRRSVLYTVRTAEEQEKAAELRIRLETYLRHTPKLRLLSPEDNQRSVQALLEDSDSDYEQLQRRLAQYDRATLATLLASREDLSIEEKDAILTQLIEIRDRVLFESQRLDEQVKAQLTTTQQKVADYLRHTGKSELDPAGIERDLKVLLQDPALGADLLRGRLSQFDRDTLVQLLVQRQDLSEAEINQVLDQAEGVWDNVIHAPQILTTKAKEQYDDATSAIADYLRSTGKSELNPAGIQRDLNLLVNNPQAGAIAIRNRLAQMDRDTFVKLLTQRGDLTEAEVNRTIDQLQQSIRTLVKAPRRLATRTQRQLYDFQTSIEQYLANTEKEELNPRAIKRDLSLLMHDPRVGIESLTDRLKQFDRATLVALLSQRQDISEEEANRFVDQILSVRDQFVDQIRAIQHRIQDAIDHVFVRIRTYLNSLDRPELNYDGIMRDVRKLFDDPQSGFDALRDRLSHFNRDTLVAVLSSREDISQADANRIVDRIEMARTSVLQRAERIQLETQRRLDEVKLQAQRQVEETRKAAASAAWWLFGTATVSAGLSALAGFLGVIRAF
ncbi:MFS transporter [Geitlerinema calcuttense]|uniref:MFS transporter n=1 Tax=Geitlerinema calcuttense NRMC-F 0142 TaxID=2922238 RepID=A0ABT7LVK1_9CYAN|nr:MFS transporter [Geitlerinema calcuttense NRMC-F 0142]